MYAFAWWCRMRVRCDIRYIATTIGAPPCADPYLDDVRNRAAHLQTDPPLSIQLTKAKRGRTRIAWLFVYWLVYTSCSFGDFLCGHLRFDVFFAFSLWSEKFAAAVTRTAKFSQGCQRLSVVNTTRSYSACMPRVCG